MGIARPAMLLNGGPDPSSWCCPNFKGSTGLQPALSCHDGGVTFILEQHHVGSILDKEPNPSENVGMDTSRKGLPLLAAGVGNGCGRLGRIPRVPR